ncbi:MAG: glycosyltransferase, partial [Candidatus Binatia bacterium]
ILEAMFLGLPVVASATGGVCEVLTDGWNGILAKPHDDLSLATGCLRIISDPSVTAKLKTNAGREIRKYESMRIMASLLFLYGEVLHRYAAG